jgi:hypothetical protein
VIAVAMTGTGRAASENDLSRCRALTDDAAKLRCFESLTPQTPQMEPARPGIAPSGRQNLPDNSESLMSGAQPAASSLPVAGKWRLVRTATRQGGEGAISIMTTADISGSDIDFAGLNLRCAEPQFEILVFLIRPLPPRARPFITMGGKKFQGSVVSPGTAILLPKEAADLATGQWQTLPSLSIKIENDGATIRGLVSLDGFDTALKTLVSACLAQ